MLDSFFAMCHIRSALRRPNAKSRKSERRRRLVTSWSTTLEAQILVPGKAFTCLLLNTSVTPHFFNQKLVLALRSRGRGRKQEDQEEGVEFGDVAVQTSSKLSDVLQKSDDIRMADMDISDDGNNFLMYKVKTWFFVFWRHLWRFPLKFKWIASVFSAFTLSPCLSQRTLSLQSLLY